MRRVLPEKHSPRSENSSLPTEAADGTRAAARTPSVKAALGAGAVVLKDVTPWMFVIGIQQAVKGRSEPK